MLTLIQGFVESVSFAHSPYLCSAAFRLYPRIQGPTLGARVRKHGNVRKVARHQLDIESVAVVVYPDAKPSALVASPTVKHGLALGA